MYSVYYALLVNSIQRECSIDLLQLIYLSIFVLVSIWRYNKNTRDIHKYPYILFSLSLLEEKVKTQKGPKDRNHVKVKEEDNLTKDRAPMRDLLCQRFDPGHLDF